MKRQNFEVQSTKTWTPIRMKSRERFCGEPVHYIEYPQDARHPTTAYRSSRVESRQTRGPLLDAETMRTSHGAPPYHQRSKIAVVRPRPRIHVDLGRLKLFAGLGFQRPSPFGHWTCRIEVFASGGVCGCSGVSRSLVAFPGRHTRNS